MPEPTIPFPEAPFWEDAVGAMLVRAAAQGRRDGMDQMIRQEADPTGPATPAADAALPPELRPMLRIALRQCYIAGRLHGAEVRRENDRRLARQEPPLGALPG